MNKKNEEHEKIISTVQLGLYHIWDENKSTAKNIL